MKPSQILRAAAQRIIEGRNGACCGAIFDVAINAKGQDNNGYSDAKKMFASLFCPGPLSEYTTWFGPLGFNKEHRAIALLLTADMAEGVGL